MNWKERLERARETREFTKEDIALAGDWPTCAVGEAAEEPLGHTGPADGFLQVAGLDFYHHLAVHRIEPAISVFNTINKHLETGVHIEQEARQ